LNQSVDCGDSSIVPRAINIVFSVLLVFSQLLGTLLQSTAECALYCLSDHL